MLTQCHNASICWVPGTTGGTGLPGEDGETGKTGLIGERGDRGRDGKFGENGKKGIIGPVGPQGSPGSRGADGYKGKIFKDFRELTKQLFKVVCRHERRNCKHFHWHGLVQFLPRLCVAVKISIQSKLTSFGNFRANWRARRHRGGRNYHRGYDWRQGRYGTERITRISRY